MLSCNLIIFEIKSNNYSQTKINNIVMNQTVDIKELNERIKQESSFVDLLTLEMNKVIVGQKHLVESLLTALLADGHILLEGVPGDRKSVV